MYQFHLSIGDWSGDGHGRSEDFTVASNAPVETVREAHYKIPEVTEVDIESICSEYGEDEIDAETVQVLKDMGFQFENSSGMGEGIVNVPEMARLWIFLLQKADPTSKDKRKKKRKKPDRRNDLLEEKRCRPYPAMA